MPVVSTPSRSYGPCEDYVTREELLNDPRACNIEDDLTATIIADEANRTLYEMLGFQYPGICTATVRPRAECHVYRGYSGLGYHDMPVLSLGMWGDWDCYSTLPLQAPIVEINEVKVNGVVLTHPENWSVLDHHILVRTDGKVWPRSQNIYLDDSLPDTFSINYSFGSPIPDLIREAALEMAVQLWLDRNTRGANTFPRSATSVTRQGVSLGTSPEADANAGSGLVALALATYNPTGAKNLSSVWSPDTEWHLHVVGDH